MLVATDGSESCKGAEQEATKRAKICSRKLLALSVVVTNREYEDALPGPWRRLIERCVPISIRSTSGPPERMDCEIVVHPGEDPYWDIVDVARKNGAALISVSREDGL